MLASEHEYAQLSALEQQMQKIQVEKIAAVPAKNNDKHHQVANSIQRKLGDLQPDQ